MESKQSGKLQPPAAAEYLGGVSTSFLAKLRVYGGGPLYSKIGKIVLYDRADLDAWLAANARASTSDAPGGGHATGAA